MLYNKDIRIRRFFIETRITEREEIKYEEEGIGDVTCAGDGFRHDGMRR